MGGSHTKAGTIQGCIPLPHPSAHTTRMLLQLKTSEEQRALCHVFFLYLDVVPLNTPDLKQKPNRNLLGKHRALHRFSSTPSDA